jgi:23S rRNA (guanosine2251-2'-O)-methyltransferase
MEKERKQVCIWGLHAVAEALEAGHPISRIYLARQARGKPVERIKELAVRRRVRFDFVEVGKLGRLAGTREHQDVVARISPVAHVALEDVVRAAGQRPSTTLVALDQVQNSRNVGLVIRTAAAAGAAAILLPTRGGSPLNDEVMRAAAGTVFRLPVVPCANLVRDLEQLKQAGFWIYGLEGGGSADLFGVDWPERRVLVAGNETRGLRPLVRKRADSLVRIPLAGGVESLNVGVALGVVLFDIVRAEQQKKRVGKRG